MGSIMKRSAFAAHRRLAVTLLIVALVAPSFGALALPKKADAFIVGMPVMEVGALLDLNLFVLAPAAVMNTAANTSEATKDFGLDLIVWIAMKVIMQQVTDSVVRWANTGFNGAPAFVSNPEAFWTRLGSDVAGEVIYENEDMNFLCSPFNASIRLNVLMETQAPRDLYNIRCTLEDVVGNIQAFTNDFRTGGWVGWHEMTMKDKNNPYGAFFDVKTNVDVIKDKIEEVEKDKLNWGEGFLTWQKCEPEGSKNCNSQTPGSVIEQQLNETLPSGMRALEAADEINEMIVALIGALVKRVVSSAGLRGQGSTDDGGAGMRGALQYTDFERPTYTPPTENSQVWVPGQDTDGDGIEDIEGRWETTGGSGSGFTLPNYNTGPDSTGGTSGGEAGFTSGTAGTGGASTNQINGGSSASTANRTTGTLTGATCPTTGVCTGTFTNTSGQTFTGGAYVGGSCTGGSCSGGAYQGGTCTNCGTTSGGGSTTGGITGSGANYSCGTTCLFTGTNNLVGSASGPGTAIGQNGTRIGGMCVPYTQTVTLGQAATLNVNPDWLTYGFGQFQWWAPGGSPSGPVYPGSPTFITTFPSVGRWRINIGNGSAVMSCEVNVVAGSGSQSGAGTQTGTEEPAGSNPAGTVCNSTMSGERFVGCSGSGCNQPGIITGPSGFMGYWTSISQNLSECGSCPASGTQSCNTNSPGNEVRNCTITYSQGTSASCLSG